MGSQKTGGISLKQKRMGSQKTGGITNKPSSGGLKVKYKHNT